MPVGVIVDAAAVFLGGLLGTVFGNKLSEELKNSLTLMFGLSSIALGINSVILTKNLPVVILSIIIGTAIGICLHFGAGVTKILTKLQTPLKAFMKPSENRDEYIAALVTAVVLFCASANGIYGALDSGFSADHTILISKAIMDLFTSMIFACNLGSVVSLICIPQFAVYFVIFLMAGLIFPLTDPVMIADFKGCGGLLMIATGIRLMKVKDFPLMDMVPALILVMPLSHLWTSFILPLI